MNWPTYQEWFESLSPPEQKRAQALTHQFRLLGAGDPESWARSEISENIAQLGRFLVLNTIKREAIDYWALTGVLDDAADEDPLFKSFLKLLRQSGFTDPQIGRFVQKVAAVTAFQILHTFDQGCDLERETMPGWSLEERDSEGNPTGRDLAGLHESFYEFDPTHPAKK